MVHERSSDVRGYSWPPGTYVRTKGQKSTWSRGLSTDTQRSVIVSLQENWSLI